MRKKIYLYMIMAVAIMVVPASATPPKPDTTQHEIKIWGVRVCGEGDYKIRVSYKSKDGNMVSAEGINSAGAHYMAFIWRGGPREGYPHASNKMHKITLNVDQQWGSKIPERSITYRGHPKEIFMNPQTCNMEVR